MRILVGVSTAILAICALGFSLSANTSLGQSLTLDETTPIPAVADNPEAYVGKTLQVKGKVNEVCERAGCWMNLVDPSSGKAIRIKVRDGVIVFPKKAIGKTALAEGKLQKIELTKEQAVAWSRHEAEENGKPFNPSDVTGPMTIYQLAGTGAVILD